LTLNNLQSLKLLLTIVLVINQVATISNNQLNLTLAIV